MSSDMVKKIENEENKVSFEDALEKAGFGMYSVLSVFLAGGTVLSSVLIVYASTIIVPTSACELDTTTTQQGVLAAAPVIALLIGSMFWGYLGDTRGRRFALILSLVAAGIVNGLASLSVNWIMLLILQFLAAMLSSGQYPLSMTLLSESVPMSKRNLLILLVTSIFILSQGIMAVLAIPIIPLSFSKYIPSLNIYWNSWRTLLLVYSIPSFLSAIGLYAMKESPKFVLAKKEEADALDILRAIYRINNRKPHSEYQVQGLLKETQQDKKKASVKEQILPLFKMPLLKYTIIMSLLFLFQQVGPLQVWLPTIANKFMQALESGALTNLTLCQFLDPKIDITANADAVPCSLNLTAMLIVLTVGALQSVANILMSMVVGPLGRRNLVIVVASTCGISGFLINLVPNTIASGVFYIVLLMAILLVGLYTAIVLSLYPTHLRALAVALTMTGGKLGSFASIQLLNWLLKFNCDAGFYIISALIASSVIVALFLPNDRASRTPVPEKTTPEISKL